MEQQKKVVINTCSIVVRQDGSLVGSIDGSGYSGQEAIICRLNSTLFEEVVRVIINRPRARIGFVGATQMSVSFWGERVKG